MANQYKNELKVKQVYATLRNGRIYSEGIWLVLCIVFLALLVTATICSIVFGIIYNDLLFSVGVASFGFFLIFIDVLFLFVVERGRSQVLKCLNDAIVIEAKCVSLGSASAGILFTAQAMAIKVTFQYGGKMYDRQSEKNGKLLYQTIFNKCVDRKISVAYSPKFDVVMLLKDW